MHIYTYKRLSLDAEGGMGPRGGGDRGRESEGTEGGAWEDVGVVRGRHRRPGGCR